MHASRLGRIANIAGAEDWEHDPWGTATALHFDIAAVLDMSDIEGSVTPPVFARWQYHASPYVTVPAIESVAARADDFTEGEWSDDFTFGTVELARGRDGEVTQADLIYAGDVLGRYTRLLYLAGKFY